MRIFFFGFGENGKKCLKALLKERHKIIQVVTPENYNAVEIIKKISRLKPDLIVVASFPKLLPAEIIFYPKFRSINVHASQLPKYRGCHPLNWAIIKDEKQVGVTIHYLDDGMDSGNILAQKTIPLTNFDNINTIKRKLTTLGARLLTQVVRKIEKTEGEIKGIKQQEDKVTFAPKRNPEDGRINWRDDARDIFNLVRALESPYPNAFAYSKKGEKIEFQKSYLSKNYGEVIGKIKEFYLISVGDGVILLKANKKLKLGERLI